MENPRSPFKVFGGKYAKISIFKAIVNATGLVYVGYPRKPHMPVSENDQKTITEIVKDICPHYIVSR